MIDLNNTVCNNLFYFIHFSQISTSTNLSHQSEASSPGTMDSSASSIIGSAKMSRQNSEIGYGSETDGKNKVIHIKFKFEANLVFIVVEFFITLYLNLYNIF